MRIFILLVCMVLLAGCGAPQLETEAGVTATLQARITSMPTPTCIPDSSIPVAVSRAECLLPARWMALPESTAPFYLASTELCPEDELQGSFSLGGRPQTKQGIQTMGEAIANESVSLNELPTILEQYGLKTEATLGTSWNAQIVSAQCTEIFDDTYFHLYLDVSPGNEGGISLFFLRNRDGYIPIWLLDHSATRISGHSFLSFAGQQWMIYIMGAWGTGYVSYQTYWYNLVTGRVELCYDYDYHDEGNVAEDVYEIQDRCVLSAQAVDTELESYIKLKAHIQLQTKYWDKTEGGDVLTYAPEPDDFAAETFINLYYDQEVNAFYIRIPIEAYPLYENYDRRLWRFYFGESLLDFKEHGNGYQKRWAELFF